MKPTRLARNLRRVSTIAIAATSVLALSTSARGQAEQPAAPEAAPQAPAPAAQPAAPAPAPSTGQAEAAPVPPPPSGGQAVPAPPASNYPTPGYGPPPGVPYQYYTGYPGYVPVPRHPVTYRPFMFGVGLGAGSLTYSSSHDTKREPGLAYSVHLGFSITARWMALLAMDGSWGQFNFTDPNTRPYGKMSVAVSTYTAGIQFFILRALYARLGLGLGCLEWSYGEGDYSDCHGQTAVGGLGYEFLQTRSTAVAAELGGFVSRFPDAMTIDDRNDVWYHIGANMALRLF